MSLQFLILFEGVLLLQFVYKPLISFFCVNSVFLGIYTSPICLPLLSSSIPQHSPTCIKNRLQQEEKFFLQNELQKSPSQRAILTVGISFCNFFFKENLPNSQFMAVGGEFLQKKIPRKNPNLNGNGSYCLACWLGPQARAMLACRAWPGTPLASRVRHASGRACPTDRPTQLQFDTCKVLAIINTKDPVMAHGNIYALYLIYVYGYIGLLFVSKKSIIEENDLTICFC